MPFTTSLKSGLNSADLFKGDGNFGGFTPTEIFQKGTSMPSFIGDTKLKTGGMNFFGNDKKGGLFQDKEWLGSLGDVLGGTLGKSKNQGTRMAGQEMANYMNALAGMEDKDKKTGPIASMGDDMFLYTPTREPDFYEYESTENEGFMGGVGRRIAGAGMGFLKGAATGMPHMAGIGAVAGALGA
jgi:hypothetical protein